MHPMPMKHLKVRLPLRAWTLVALIALGGCLASCGGDPLGSACNADPDCVSGLQCFKPPLGQGSAGVCTIGCSSEACPDGTCVTSDFGSVCAADCLKNSDCPSGLTCQETPKGRTVCWYPDSHFAKIPDSVQVAKTVVVDDTNADGELNPGERARLQFFPVNLGSTQVTGLWAELLSWNEHISVVGCLVETATDWVACSADCSCEEVSSAAKMTLAPGTGSALPVLEVTFDLAQSVDVDQLSFTLRMHDAFGRTWDHSVKVPVAAINSSIMIASSKLTSDTNDDGFLSVGENGTLEIIAQNPGETQVQGLYAELLSTSPGVVALACYAGVGESWVKCDAKCNCKNAPAVAKQTLEPSGVGHVPIYRIDFRVEPATPVGPIQFDVAFNDGLDLRWTGSAKLAITTNEATLAFSHVEVIDDANEDGIVSPKEPASVQVFVQNTGTSKATGIWAELLSSSDEAIVEGCSVGIAGSWYPCDLGCSCASALASSKQVLESGQVGDVAVLRIDFWPDIDEVQGEVSFSVAFHDETGGTWNHSFTVGVLPLDASIEVGATALLSDDNGDGFLSPGENITLEIYPKNIGSSKALGLFARVIEADPMTEIVSCYTHGSNQTWAQCDYQCNCHVVPEETRQDLAAASLGGDAILQINFQLDTEAPLSPLWFTVAFEDRFGNVWLDQFYIPVVAINATLAVDTAQLWNDTNDDGQLSPGEDVSIQVYAKNIGSTKTFGIYAELLPPEDFVDVSSCYTQFDTTWAKCTASCNCENVSSSVKQELEANEIGLDALLRFNLHLAADAPLEPLSFTVRFYDQLGNSWDDTFYVDVEKHKAEISVAFTNIVEDSNADGKLSAGETASILVYPRNTGPVKAIDVWAALLAKEQTITINACHVAADGAWAACNSDCACEGMFDSALQTLEAGKTSDVPILKMDVTLAHDAPVQPVDFSVSFFDKLQVGWSDGFSVDVVVPDTTIEVGPIELVNDSGSGVENADGDGVLNPGETATLQVYPQNSGATNGVNIWAHLESFDANVEILSCFVASPAGEWAQCDQSCSCEYVFDAMKADVEGNSTGSAVVLQINFKLAEQAPPFPVQFVLGFHDEFGNTWFDGFTRAIELPGN